MDLSVDRLQEALETLGAVLESRRSPTGLLIVGGSSLLLLGLIDRPTADIDVIALSENGVYRKATTLPGPLAEAASEVARALGLAGNWLNTGPADLMDFGLPEGWQSRIEVRRYSALEVHVPCRIDQICFKLYAAVDRGPRDKHYLDLQRFKPTADELLRAARWTMTHDPSAGFRSNLVECLASLDVELSDGDL